MQKHKSIAVHSDRVIALVVELLPGKLEVVGSKPT